MIEKMIANIVPLLLAKVGKVPGDQKLAFASLLYELCDAYLLDDRERFEEYLLKTDFPVAWKVEIAAALWNETQNG